MSKGLKHTEMKKTPELTQANIFSDLCSSKGHERSVHESWTALTCGWRKSKNPDAPRQVHSWTFGSRLALQLQPGGHTFTTHGAGRFYGTKCQNAWRARTKRAHAYGSNAARWPTAYDARARQSHASSNNGHAETS